MSTASIEERQFSRDITGQLEREKRVDSPFWKRYMDKEDSNGLSVKEESKPDSNIERMSPIEMESTSLLDWTFEEQFKQLYELDDDPERKNFLDDYFEFMRKRGTPVNRIPIMAKQILDLYQLYRLVVQHGGLVQVIRNKQWSKITRGLNLPASITSAAFTLRTQYLKYLYTYECVMHAFSTPKELQAAIDNNKRDRFSTFYPSQPTMTLSNDGRYPVGPSSSNFSTIYRPTPTHSLYRGMPLTMKRRMDVIDNRIVDKSGMESPKVVILRNGSPVFVNPDAVGTRSPSAQRHIHPRYEPRDMRHDSPLHEPESKRPYQVLYGRSEWDGDIRQIIQGDHKENLAYLRDRKTMNGAENESNSKYLYAEFRDTARSAKVPCPCSYCVADQPDNHRQSPVLSTSNPRSPVTQDSDPTSKHDDQHKQDSSLNGIAMEEKMEKDSSDSSSGFEELSPNAQSLSEDRPESKQGQKITDINMKIGSDVTSPVSVIKIAMEINGVVYRGSLERDVRIDESTNESQKE
eukprot:gene10170-11209_t